MDRKRLLAIIGFTILCLTLGFIIYRVFFAPSLQDRPVDPITSPTPTGEFPIGGTATPPTGGVETDDPSFPIAPTVDEPVITFSDEDARQTNQVVIDNLVGADIGFDGDVRFYNETDGRFYRFDGSIPQLLDDDVFFNVESVTWSPTKNESVIEYPDGANIYYNFDTKKQVTLPRHWESFTFAPQGDKVGAKSVGLSPENRWLISSNPDGSSISLIEPMGDNANKVHVDWSPNNQVIALSRTGQALGGEREEVLFVGMNGENFKSITVEGRGFEQQWSPDGKQLLYSVFSSRSNFLPELWIVAGQGERIGSGRQLIGLNTWTDKCSFQNTRYLYCAVPIGLERGAGYAPALADDLPHTMYKVDLQTGLKTEIPLQDFHVVETIHVEDNGRNLYFTDKLRPGLFELPL